MVAAAFMPSSNSTGADIRQMTGDSAQSHPALAAMEGLVRLRFKEDI